jgi:hypothetical protein
MNSTRADLRLFTLAEAQKMLPLVSSIVGDIVREYKSLRENVSRLAEMKRRGGASRTRDEVLAREKIEGQVAVREQRVHSCIEELTALGVEFKDYSVGLVDFPACRRGDVVHWCWKLGEARVSAWHPADTGCAGRLPVILGEDTEAE